MIMEYSVVCPIFVSIIVYSDYHDDPEIDGRQASLLLSLIRTQL